MLIIGIDPGSRFCGYGLLQFEGRKITAAGCDVIDVSNYSNLSDRLRILYDELTEILTSYKPDYAAIETMFLSKHTQSIFTLGHARGVLLLALAKANISVMEYSPREIKKAIVGNGNATKQQVRFMVSSMFKLSSNNKKDDAYDALSTAFCHYNKLRFS